MSVIVGYSQSLPAFCSSLGKNCPAAGRGHSFSETVFVPFFSVRWLKCTFHCTYFLILFFRLRTAKVDIFLIPPKRIALFSAVKFLLSMIPLL